MKIFKWAIETYSKIYEISHEIVKVLLKLFGVPMFFGLLYWYLFVNDDFNVGAFLLTLILISFLFFLQL